MSIKYGSHDLVKRIIDWHNVEKVIYNGNQIWPSSPQPQPTYHIVWDFTQWSLPSWWSSTYGGVSYSNNWISLDTTGWTDYVTIKNQNSMPSLVNASRIKIDYDFYRTDVWESRGKWGWWIYTSQWSQWNNQLFISGIGGEDWPDEGDSGVFQFWKTIDEENGTVLNNPVIWKYTLSVDFDLITQKVTQTLTYPDPSISSTLTFFTYNNIPLVLRNYGDEFRITLFEWITMSDMNMYIWYMTPPVTKPWLCFTANTWGSTIELDKIWNPTIVTLETSIDWETWTTYTIWTPITLSNIGDKIYWRNISNVTTGFSTYEWKYTFVMTGSISASWDVTSLINKNCTDTISTYFCFAELFVRCASLTTAPELPATTLAYGCYDSMFQECTSLATVPELPATTLADYCYRQMFYRCISLTTVPELPATTLADYCYEYMFYRCASLTTIPELPATTLADHCYEYMFDICTLIKLSETQTWEYQTPYRIPTSWTWTVGTDSLYKMFDSTWWTFRGTPELGRTYYTSNTVI